MRTRILLTTALITLAVPAVAEAAQRYVATDGSGAVCTSVAPCDLVTGFNNAGANDEVIIAPGTYTTATALSNASNNLDVHGQAGGPRPVLKLSADIGLSLNGFNIHAGDLTIEHTGSRYGVSLFSNSSDFDHLQVRSSGSNACYFGISSVFRDSLCVATADGANAVLDEFSGPPGAGKMRNLTAIAKGSGSIALIAGAQSSSTSTIDARNMILQGTIDVQAQTSDPGSFTAVSLVNSNYDTTNTVGANTAVTPAGSGSNQTAQPKFAEKRTYTEAFGSPTIDAGAVDADTGSTDLFGDPRPLGAGMDIGADEYVPDNFPPDTTITKGPAKKSSSKAKFKFESTEAGSTFRCALDKKLLKPCKSPAKLKRLKPGKHTFSVQATDAATNVDASPATYKWTVKKKPRKHHH